MVADADPEQARKKINNHPNGRATWLDVMKSNDRKDLIERADIVVSLLPPHLHIEIAYDCIRLKKHLITSSHITSEMFRLGDEARNRELIFIGEMGLDPSVKHMSSKQKIDQIKAQGGKITSFKSYTGGLIMPECDDNPWHYKLSWNPENVVLAGQGSAQYLDNGKYKYVPYNRLFSSCGIVSIEGMGDYEMYPNRDSLLYREVYGLKNVPTILRGTLRNIGFCKPWNALIKIGLTDSNFPILETNKLSYHNLMDAFLANDNLTGTVKERTATFLGEEVGGEVMNKLEWLGLFRKKRINIERATPALLLQKLLIDKWGMKEKDKDMVLMQHEIQYTLNGENKELKSTLVLKGMNAQDTAMSRLIGLPIGIFVKKVMLREITQTGIHVPVSKPIYEPALQELSTYGIQFNDTHRTIDPD